VPGRTPLGRRGARLAGSAARDAVPERSAPPRRSREERRSPCGRQIRHVHPAPRSSMQSCVGAERMTVRLRLTDSRMTSGRAQVPPGLPAGASVGSGRRGRRGVCRGGAGARHRWGRQSPARSSFACPQEAAPPESLSAAVIIGRAVPAGRRARCQAAAMDAEARSVVVVDHASRSADSGVWAIGEDVCFDRRVLASPRRVGGDVPALRPVAGALAVGAARCGRYGARPGGNDPTLARTRGRLRRHALWARNPNAAVPWRRLPRCVEEPAARHSAWASGRVGAPG
jgi:hypothetical protein